MQLAGPVSASAGAATDGGTAFPRTDADELIAGDEADGDSLTAVCADEAITGELEMASGTIAGEELVRPGNDLCLPQVADSFVTGRIPSETFAAPCAASANSAWLPAAFGTMAAGEVPAFVEATAVAELPEAGAGVPLPLPTAMTTTFLLTTGEGLDFVAETTVT